MDRFEKANDYHKKGFNCCQSVLAAFSDLTGLSEQASFDIGGGFGGGAGTGELCGAISGAVMTLGLLTPDDTTPAAKAMGLTGHCDIMIVTAVEIVEELLAERA